MKRNFPPDKSDPICPGLEHALDCLRWWRQQYQRSGMDQQALAVLPIEQTIIMILERERSATEVDNDNSQ